MNTRHHSTAQKPEIVPLPVFQDNYIWLLQVGNRAAVVDPGDAGPVEHWLRAHDLTLSTILITHHHADHTGGILQLVADRDIPVFGPRGQPIDGVNRQVGEHDVVHLPDMDLSFDVLEVPGHTRTHVAYLSGDMLFPGDTLFSGGCGRLLGGTASQLHASLERLAALPPDTRVFCTHEYTLANLAFATAAEPHNPDRDAWRASCESLRARGVPTLPSTIAREKRINPFLRAGQPEVLAAVAAHTGQVPADSLACFTALRAWKDTF